MPNRLIISVTLLFQLSVVCSAAEIRTNKFSQEAITAELETVKGLASFSDPVIQYAEEYRRILREILPEEEVEILVHDRIEDVKNSPSEIKNRRTAAKTLHGFDPTLEGKFCGVLYPNVHEYEDAPYELPLIIDDTTVPEGCSFTQTPYQQRKLLCTGRNINSVPPLPHELDYLVLADTGIETVSRRNFANVSIGSIEIVQTGLTILTPWAFCNVKGIETLKIVDTDLEYLAFEVFNGLLDLYALWLDRNHISLEIYKDCHAENVSEIPIVLPNLKILSLKQNPLRTIPAQMWAALRESQVELLDISYCSLEQVHEDSLTFLTKLKTLYLDGNPDLMPTISTVLKGLRKGSLETISLSSNGLTKFPTEALSMIGGSLSKLTLSDNPISSLSVDEIPKNIGPSLRALYMKGCNLNYIQSGALDSFPSLEILDLGGNMLKRLPEMRMLTRLTHLDISSNYEKENPSDVCQGCDQLYFRIPDYGFRNLTRLSRLSLSNTPIKTVYKNTFYGLQRLMFLYLDNSRIDGIENFAFQTIQSLHTLNLAKNPNLGTINSLTFFGLQTLVQLDLSSCNLEFPDVPTVESSSADENQQVNNSDKNYCALNEEISETAVQLRNERPFTCLQSLKSLYLSNNKIIDVYKDLFHGLINLGAVYLDGNRIESWNGSIFRSNHTSRILERNNGIAPSTRVFSLSSNKLTSITGAMIQDLVHLNPHEVDLSANTVFCDTGACLLRTLILDPENITGPADPIEPFLPHWVNYEEYKCIDRYRVSGQDLVHIWNITDEVCAKNEVQDSIDITTSPSSKAGPVNDASDWRTLSIIIAASCTAFLAVGTAGYKQRAQIRYFLFRAKIDIAKIPRKVKTSTTDLIDLDYDYDLFVSYHNEDGHFIVDKFLPAVEAQKSSFVPQFNPEKTDTEAKGEEVHAGPQGFKVCLHERDFEAGMPIAENIVDAVDRSRKVVIIVSTKYLESQWCTYEMNLVYHKLIESRRRSFVVILLEEVPPTLRTKVLNYLMCSRTYLQWPGENASTLELQRFWTRLKQSLKSRE